MLVAIDNGYWDTKVYDGQNRFSFRSRVEKGNDLFSTNNTHLIFFNGEEYLVGEGASMKDLNHDKTNNDLHKLCTYTALARLSNLIGTEFKIVVGYPLTFYASQKEVFSHYLMEDSKKQWVEIEIDGELKRFKIIDCLVLPQGAGALYSNPSEYENKLVGIIDIGGLTINGCLFENLNIIKKSIFTVDMGIYNLYNTIKKELESNFGISVFDYEIPHIITQGYINEFNEHQPEIDEFIQNILDKHVFEIKNILEENNWSLRTDILLVGGGSILLAKYFKKHIPKSTLSPDPVWQNVIGFYNVGMMYYGCC